MILIESARIKGLPDLAPFTFGLEMLRKGPAVMRRIERRNWWFDQIPAMYAAQALTAEQIQTFKELPSRQKPAAFNLDRILEKMQEAADGSLH